jgi:hypothetical protein
MELAQQMLMSAGLPWMPLWGQQLLDGTLEKYKVLVVPGCACMSREEVSSVIGFVESGGGVVILEGSGCFNERHQTIGQWRFAPLFEAVADPEGLQVRYAARQRSAGLGHEQGPLFATFGKGKALYLPQIRKTRECVHSYEEIGGYDGFQHLELPRNWRNLPRAVERVAPGGVMVKVDGPRTLMPEFFSKDKRLLVHLVNYASTKQRAGAEVLVAGKGGKTATLHTPGERTERREIRATAGKKGGTAFRLPGFTRYALLDVNRPS